MITGQHSDAQEAYARAVNLNPNDPELWCSLGVLYMSFAQYREALGMFARATRLDPKMAEAAIQQAMKLFKPQKSCLGACGTGKASHLLLGPLLEFCTLRSGRQRTLSLPYGKVDRC